MQKSPEGDVQTPKLKMTLEALQPESGTQEQQETKARRLKKCEEGCLRG